MEDLRSLQEEFSDSRYVVIILVPPSNYPCSVQHTFARVKDPNVCPATLFPITCAQKPLYSSLPKFVQVNWCGDGVPEA